MSQRSSGDGQRRFFDKVTRDPSATFNADKDGSRFLSALLSYDDRLDMLFRLNSPKEFGMKRLKTALASSASPAGLNSPFFAVLGIDKLTGGSCRIPLMNLIREI